MKTKISTTLLTTTTAHRSVLERHEGVRSRSSIPQETKFLHITSTTTNGKIVCYLLVFFHRNKETEHRSLSDTYLYLKTRTKNRKGHNDKSNCSGQC